MSVTKKAKKLIFDIAKKNKAFRLVFRGSRDTAYRAKMTLDDPFGKIDDKLVYFRTFSGRGYSDSPKAMYEYMLTAPEYRDFRFVWCFKEPEKFAFLKNDRTELVKFRTKADNKALRKAKYWITDNNIERSLNFKNPKTKYLNTWHGVALKTIGNDDKFSGTFDYSDIDYLCVSCEHDKRVYTTALNASPDCFLECGMPRNDSLFNVSEADRFDLRMKLDIPVDKKVILFAPTWRDSVNGGDSFDLDIPVHFDKWREALGDDYMIMFRAHDRTSKLMNVEFDDFVVNYSTYEPLNDLMIAADILVTDYSSICFDWSLLEKPFICFGYDWEQYKEERGVYFDAEEVYYGGILRTEAEVIDRILNMDYPAEVEGVRKLRDQFMTYSKPNAAEICVKALFGDVVKEESNE